MEGVKTLDEKSAKNLKKQLAASEAKKNLATMIKPSMNLKGGDNVGKSYGGTA